MPWAAVAVDHTPAPLPVHPQHQQHQMPWPLAAYFERYLLQPTLEPAQFLVVRQQAQSGASAAHRRLAFPQRGPPQLDAWRLFVMSGFGGCWLTTVQTTAFETLGHWPWPLQFGDAWTPPRAPTVLNAAHRRTKNLGCRQQMVCPGSVQYGDLSSRLRWSRYANAKAGR